MSKPKLVSPLLDNYVMGDPISEKQGIRCCPALEKDQQTKCIVKIISTPTSQAQLDALILSGAYADAQAALDYFQSVAEGIIDEAKVLQRLSSLEGFFPYINWQLVPMTDGIGFDVYTLSEYRKSLAKLLNGNCMTHLNAVNLALDLCTALAVCRRIGFLYVNLKPENIYLADNNTWKIGDIGFVSLSSLKYASLPERYRNEYTAPEIADAFASLNTTLDVYALGLVLYRIFNGNQLPVNLGKTSQEDLLPPDYADYEMAEIILKACNPDPEKRWQDPIEMGQALVSYMQRNGVNDTPIVPPVVVPPVTESTVDDANNTTNKSVNTDFDAENSAGDDVLNDVPESVSDEHIQSDTEEYLADILTPTNDETAPEQNQEQLNDISVTDEVSSILSQADDLLAHHTPQMSDLEMSEDASASEDETKNTDEAIIISIPENEIETDVERDLEEVPSSSSDDSDVNHVAESEHEETLDEGSTVEVNETPEDTSADNEVKNAEDVGMAPTSPQEIPIESNDDMDEDPTDDDDIEPEKQSHWLRNILIAAAGLILALLLFLFYTKYYVQTIDDLVVIHSPNGNVTVEITTQCDQSKLSVLCIDAYGNPRTAPVVNKIATFEDLAPGAAYTIEIKISGFHKLKGVTEDGFTTPSETQIVQFDAVTGNEDGSVILSFSIKEQDSEMWNITYTADDGAQIIETFSGHMHTIQGLTVGNEYTFKLAPESDIKYKGITEITHTASAVIIPENLQIVSILDGKLTANWSAPAGADVVKWKVHCYNDNGFEYVSEIDATTVTIAGIDSTVAHTLEVAAEGMSMALRTDAPANSITVTDFKVSESKTKLDLSWVCANTESPSNWLLSYTVDGSQEYEYTCDGISAYSLENPIPGAKYAFTIKTVDGTAVLGGQLLYNTAKVVAFSDYNVKASDMRFHSCRTPSKSNWDKKDLKESDYTSTFKADEKMSFLVELKDSYNPSTDQIITMFVFRDENGSVVQTSTSVRTWKQMWYKGLCELDVPSIPSAPGRYTVSIYMNGYLAGKHEITIVQ